MIFIKCDGAEITETNYFDSEMAEAGALGLSVHNLCIHVLVPEVAHEVIPDMVNGAKEALLVVLLGLNTGTEGIAFQFVMNDGSQQPWSFCGGVSSLIGAVHIPPDSTFSAALWTRSEGSIVKFWEGPGAIGLAPSLPVELPL